MHSFRYTAVLALGAALAAPPVLADDGWKHEIAPYVWGSGMDGSTGVGDAIADVDMSFGDILEDLELGFMGAYRASKDRYSITFDVVYMGLGVTQRGRGGALKADVDLDQTGIETDFGYALSDRMTVLAGLRYVDLSVKVRATGPLGETREGDADEDWIDPVVGAMYLIPFSDEWSLNLRGDVGGFGVGSDFAWQAVATLRWQFSPHTGALAAYRYLDMDYENGNGDHRFIYDMAISGPALGFVLTF
jgi:hypothetical protein